MTQGIDSLSDGYDDYYTNLSKVEEQTKWLQVEPEESIIATFQRLGDLPRMSRCSKIDFEVTVFAEDKEGNRAGASVKISGESDRSSESNESSSSNSSDSANDSKK